MRHEIIWTDDARAELDRISRYYRRAIGAAIFQLVHEPTIETRNRKPLDKAMEGLPFPIWELRVQPYRVFYEVEEGRTVRIRRVILKGSRTTEEAIRRRTKR